MTIKEVVPKSNRILFKVRVSNSDEIPCRCTIKSIEIGSKEVIGEKRFDCSKGEFTYEIVMELKKVVNVSIWSSIRRLDGNPLASFWGVMVIESYH